MSRTVRIDCHKYRCPLIIHLGSILESPIDFKKKKLGIKETMGK